MTRYPDEHEIELHMRQTRGGDPRLLSSRQFSAMCEALLSQSTDEEVSDADQAALDHIAELYSSNATGLPQGFDHFDSVAKFVKRRKHPL